MGSDESKPQEEEPRESTKQNEEEHDSDRPSTDEVEILRSHAFTPAPSKGWTQDTRPCEAPGDQPVRATPADDLVLEDLKMEKEEEL